MAEAVGTRNTLYMKLYRSPVNQALRQRPAVAGAGAGAVGAGLYWGAMRSRVFRVALSKGILPVSGAGLALLGGSMAYDGARSDMPGRPIKAAGKVVSGAALVAGGASLVGKSIGVQALVNGPRNLAVVGASALVGGGMVAYDAFRDARTRPVTAAGKGALAAGMLTAGVQLLRGRFLPTGSFLESALKATRYPQVVGPTLVVAGAAWLIHGVVDGQEQSERTPAWDTKHHIDLYGSMTVLAAGAALASQAIPAGAGLAGRLARIAVLTGGAGLAGVGINFLQEASAIDRTKQPGRAIAKAVAAALAIGGGSWLAARAIGH